MYIKGTGLGCGVYRLDAVNETTKSEDIDSALNGVRYNGRYYCAFVYAVVDPAWKKVIAAFTKKGFKVAVKNKTAVVMLKATGKKKKANS